MADRGEKLDIGLVFELAWGSLKRNPRLYGLIALIFGAVPQILIGWATLAVRGPGVLRQGDPSNFGGSIVGLLVTALLYTVSIRAVVRDLDGEPEDLKALAEHAGRRFVPVFGLMLLSGIAIIIALALFVAPGLFLITLWAVAVPVKVMEDRPFFECFGRSADLTRGRRWAILGLFLLGILLMLLLSFVIYVPLGLMGAATGALGAFGYVMMIPAGIVGAITSVVWAACVGALYYRLRGLKEGPGAESLDTVFA